jgi:hypothetical protein
MLRSCQVDEDEIVSTAAHQRWVTRESRLEDNTNRLDGRPVYDLDCTGRAVAHMLLSAFCNCLAQTAENAVATVADMRL